MQKICLKSRDLCINIRRLFDFDDGLFGSCLCCVLF